MGTMRRQSATVERLDHQLVLAGVTRGLQLHADWQGLPTVQRSHVDRRERTGAHVPLHLLHLQCK